MKKTITESQLRNIVAESVKKVLKESTLYCDTQPFKDIYRAATQIMEKFEYTQKDEYEPWDDCDGRDLSPEVYQWAKKIADEAEDWLQYNSTNQSINGGENW